MVNSTKESSGQFHEVIATKHVYLKDNQIYIRRVSIETIPEEFSGVEWFPTNFNWVSN